MTAFKFLVTLALLGVLLVLAVQNPQPVVINFLKWKLVPTSVLVIILASLMVGIVCGFFMGWSPRRTPPPAAENDDPPAEPE